jgi:hypothetical protein
MRTLIKMSAWVADSEQVVDVDLIDALLVDSGVFDRAEAQMLAHDSGFASQEHIIDLDELRRRYQ